MHHVTIEPTPFSRLGLIWHGTAATPVVHAIHLPNEYDSALTDIPDVDERSCAVVDTFCDRIRRYLSGENLTLPLDLLDLDRRPTFQQRVLRAEYAVPRGRVTTYGQLARSIGAPRAARAVGRALGTNPFPIVIPCHRAVRGDGGLGGYRGGVAMKRRLLGMEGVAVTDAGVVGSQMHWYG